MKVNRKTLPWLLAAPLFILMVFVYANSIPASFNTHYENRYFFDSDGEFIVRQFRKNKTFTHNDHLLYHVVAKEIVQHIPSRPNGKPDIVRGHRVLSMLFGALGVVTLYLGGLWLGGGMRAALGAAVFAGGAAAFWFFSTTIDTYIPHLWAAIIALLLALKCLRDQHMADYAWLGLAAAIAFLFRTDAILLATLGVVAFADRPALSIACRRLALCAGVVIVVGLGGYAFLANAYYGVPVEEVFSWMSGSNARPEVSKGVWGQIENLTVQNLYLTALNHLSYGVVIPGVDSTRSVLAFDHYAALGWGFVSWVLWVAAGLVMTAILLIRACKGETRCGWMLALIALWIVPRIVFYSWWDPFDPFLFSVTSLPALWLLVIAFSLQPQGDPKPGSYRFRWIVVAALAAAVCLHNFHYLIGFLREFA